MAKNVLLKLVLTLTCVMVGLSAFAQGKPVTLNAVDMPLPDALVKIERMSEYYKFNYNVRSLQQFKVTASISNQQAPEAVSTLISGLPLSMNVNGKYIEISSKNAAAQTSSTPRIKGITGEVLDEDGEPLVGVHVREKGSKNGVITDMDGRFKISTNADKMRLTLSYLGMKDAEVTATNGVPVRVVMITNSVSVGEVVVTGYQVIDKRASTSAITSIKAEDVIRPDAISIDQMLEGQVPDLMYMSNSGESGAAPKIRIRGTSSIIGNREPLWVVDGIVVNDPVAISAEDLNDPDYVNRIGNAIAGLNPQDIERLDVLKDASATALYGTKAANGVIVITTKRGQQGPTTVRYSNSFTWKRRPRYSDRSVDVMNSFERVQFSRDLFAQHYNYESNVTMVGYELALQRFYQGLTNLDEFNAEVARYETVNTDWFDILTHDSFSQQHTVNISGGNEKVSYYGSLGYTDNDDVVKGTTNRRYNAMVNMDINFSKWITAAFGIQGNVSNRDYYQTSLAPVQYAYKMNRAVPCFTPDGELDYYQRQYTATLGATYKYNILNELANSGVNQDGSSVTFNGNLRFKFNSWLSANAIFSYTNSSTTIDDFWGESTWYAACLRSSEFGETPPSKSLMPQGGELNHQLTKQKSWTARLQLDWNKYFNDELHNFAGGIGIEASQNKYQGYANTTRGYMPDRGLSFVQGIDLTEYPDYMAWMSSNMPVITDSKSNILSGYVTVSYNYDRLIYLNTNARVDGSNNFGDTSNDKFLPIFSVSGSFDASRLKWFRELTWLDQFSIKGSYGYQGNMLSDQSPVMIIRKGAFNSFYNEYMSTVERNPNPELKWERTTSYNLGFVWSFFDRKLQIDADFYWKRTKDAFMSKTVSTVNGYQSYIVNGGDIDNDGYSIGVTVRPIQTKDWQWSISTVFSRAINRIKTAPAGESYELNDFLNGNAVVKDKPIGTFYSYKFLGLNPEDGGPMFDDWKDHYYDLMGLSKYDTYTRVLVATGSREPIMSGSFTTQLRWKDLRLSANFAYSLGAKTRLFGMYGAGTNASGVYAANGEIRPENNMSRDYLYTWHKPGDEKYTDIPAIIGSGHSSYFNYSQHFSTNMSNENVQLIANDYWDMYDYSDLRVVSSDYLKLNTLSLSYLVPSQWIRPWGLKRLEVTASATNVFTVCDKKLKGQTPTQGGFSTIQLSDRPGYSVGLSVTF